MVSLVIAIALGSACGGGSEGSEPARATIAIETANAENSDLFDLYLIDANGTNRRRLVQDAHSPAWSPDGRQIAFIGGPGDLYVLDADGGEPRRLTQGATAPVWSPEGSKIAVTIPGEENFTETSHIDVLDSDGSDRRRLVPFQAGNPSWSPDGKRIAFARWFAIDFTDIYVVDADGSGLRRLTRSPRRGFGSDLPAWSPDGRRIAFVSSRLEDLESDDYGSDLYVIDVDGTGLRRVTTTPPATRGDSGPVWSPDGQRLAFVRSSSEGVSDIYVVEPDDGRVRRLTRAGRAGEPAWSPDGRRIVFTQVVPAGETEQADLFVVNADGSGLRRLTDTPDNEGAPVWSPQ